MTDLNVEGMAVAPSVVETIITYAVKEVEGVASIGSSPAGLLNKISKPAPPSIEVSVSDDKKIEVAVHINVKYGFVLPEVAANVRKAIADAVAAQVGTEVSYVDVYIDGIEFAN